MAITNISVFTSLDQGAVVGVNGRCSGTAGDGIALLNQLLLTGYNWLEVTAANLTQAANVATLTLTSHGFNTNQRLWLCGTDQSGYISDAIYLTSVVDGNTVTFPVTGGPASPSTASGSTTLSAAIVDTTGTVITVSDGSSFPSSGQTIIKIDNEYMLVTAGLGTNTWQVVRGFAQSTAATHINGSTVDQKILIGVAPAGGYNHWTSPYTDTNKACYRPPAGNRFYIAVDDTFTTYFKIRGFESMWSATAGSGPFPTPLQYADATTGQSTTKSTTASIAARNWVAMATDRSFYLFTDAANQLSNPTSVGGFFIFTDLVDLYSTGTDNYATLLITESTNGQGTSSNWYSFDSTGIANHYMPRAYTQIGQAINVGKDSIDNRANTSLGGTLTFPHPPDGYIYASKIAIFEYVGAGYIHRGNLPGIWNPLHAKSFQHLDQFTGTGTLAGKKFMAVNCYSGSQFYIEISNTIQAT